MDGYAFINKDSQFNDIWIELKNGDLRAGFELDVSPVETIWKDAKTGQLITVPTSSIAYISYRKHFMGSIEGLGLGVLLGGLGGASAGYASSDDPSSSFQINAEGKAYLAGIYYGFWGGLIGLPIGGIIGSNQIYIIETDSTAHEQKP